MIPKVYVFEHVLLQTEPSLGLEEREGAVFLPEPAARSEPLDDKERLKWGLHAGKIAALLLLGRAADAGRANDATYPNAITS